MDEKDLMIKNRECSIDKLEGALEEYKSIYGRYEKAERIRNRIRRWLTYPSDKLKALKYKKTFDEKSLKGPKPSSGLNTGKRDKKIIVSLTSYPKRIDHAPVSIASMLRQTMKPDKIILYLAKEDFPDRRLPAIYKKIRDCGVEIRFRDDLKVHMKYYYAFKEFPDDLVITVDDDILYRKDVIEELYKSYITNPNEIHAAYVNQLTFDDKAHLLGYENWNFRFINKDVPSSHQYMALGVGGVIYAPSLLCSETLNAAMIKELCPTNDDIWLKFMEVLSNVKVHNVAMKETGMVLRDTQRGIALGITNMTQGRNDNQLKAMVEHYNHFLDKETVEEKMAYDT